MPLAFQLKQAEAALKKQYELLHEVGVLPELPKTTEMEYF